MKIDKIVEHVQQTTRSCGSSTQFKKVTTFFKRTTLGVLVIFAGIVVVIVGQAHQRAKVDGIAVLEGKIPAITISR